MRLSPSGKLGDPEVCSSVPPSSVRRIRLSVMWRTIQAFQLPPYRAGVAGRSRTRLRAAPAFHPCSCPLLLSDSGKVVASKSFTLNFGHLRWQFTRCAPRRTVSLHPAQAWSNAPRYPVRTSIRDTVSIRSPLWHELACGNWDVQERGSLSRCFHPSLCGRCGGCASPFPS